MSRSDAAWETTRRYVTQLDADTRAELQRLEAALGPEREQTKRLQILLDSCATNPKLLDHGFADAVAHFVRSLSKR